MLSAVLFSPTYFVSSLMESHLIDIHRKPVPRIKAKISFSFANYPSTVSVSILVRCGPKSTRPRFKYPTVKRLQCDSRPVERWACLCIRRYHALGSCSARSCYLTICAKRPTVCTSRSQFTQSEIILFFPREWA